MFCSLDKIKLRLGPTLKKTLGILLVNIDMSVFTSLTLCGFSTAIFGASCLRWRNLSFSGVADILFDILVEKPIIYYL